MPKRLTSLILIISIMIYFEGILICPSSAVESTDRLAIIMRAQEHRPDIRYQEFFFYILGPDDVIKINVWRHPEFTSEVTVSPDGTITLPLTSDVVRVAGLTREELASELMQLMNKYVRKPKVTIDIVVYNSKIYYVFGDVKLPGKFAMKKSIITLRDALVEAGLPNKTAALGSVHIITPDPNRPTYKVINASRILYKGDLRHNIILKPGDVVYVPNSFINETAFILNQILGPLNNARWIKEDIDFLR